MEMSEAERSSTTTMKKQKTIIETYKEYDAIGQLIRFNSNNLIFKQMFGEVIDKQKQNDEE